MISIETIIAITALIAGFGVLLAAINAENNSIQHAASQVTAKTKALNCSAIIDSIYSNTAAQYSKQLECTGDTHLITAEEKGTPKNAWIITTVKKENQEIEKTTHYTE